MFKKIILFLIALALTPGFFFGAYLLLRTEEVKKGVDDSRMNLYSHIIFEPENAFHDLLRASSTMPSAETRIRTNSRITPHLQHEEWDDSFVTATLTAYQTSLEHVHLAATRNVYQDPNFKNHENISFKMPIHSLAHHRELSRISALQAYAYAQAGHPDQGLDEALRLVRLGKLLEESPQGSLLIYLTGMTSKRLGLDAILHIAKTPSLSVEKLRQVSSLIDEYRDTGKGLEAVWKVEYLQFKNGFLPDNPASFAYNPDETLRYLLEAADLRIARIATPCTQFASTTPVKRSPFVEGDTEAELLEKTKRVPNSLGKMLVDTVTTDVDALYYKRCEEEASINAIAALGNF